MREMSNPVAWLPKRRWEQMTAAEPWLTNIVYSEDQGKFFECVPLYSAPVDLVEERDRLREENATVSSFIIHALELIREAKIEERLVDHLDAADGLLVKALHQISENADGRAS